MVIIISSQDQDAMLVDVHEMEVDEISRIRTQITIRLLERRTIVDELAHERLMLLKDYSMMLYHAKCHRDTRRLYLDCVKIKYRWVTKRWGSKIEIKGIDPSRVLQLHKAIRDSLAHTMDDQEKMNARLKKRVENLEMKLKSDTLLQNNCLLWYLVILLIIVLIKI